MVLASAEEKFFFHMHNFDDTVIDEPPPEEEEDLPPPPPVFTESELEAAKKKAFNEGHAKGVSETEASRAQALADMMQKLATDTQTIFAAEIAREKLYEQEAVSLCRALFERAFPTVQKKHGFDALIAQLETVLQAQQGQKSIEVRVSSDFVQGVEAFMDKLLAQNSDLNFNVIDDETLESGSFRLGWDNGGALYDSPALIETILANLDEMLAGNGVTSHNDSRDESNISGDGTPENNDVNNDNPIAEDKNDDG